MRYIWEEKKDVLIDWRGGERQNLRMAPRFLARIVWLEVSSDEM